MTITTVVGARPQFVKAAILSRAFKSAGIQERLVHTGQHYDSTLSDVFFSELEIPAPDVNLEVGSGTHALQTGLIMTRLDEVLGRNPTPDALLVYGDTNTTLASVLVASKRHIPVIHVEAGLRSHNRKMPEELNRLITDRLASILFCPTPASVALLLREGISDGVYLSGDVMYEATVRFAENAKDRFHDLSDGSFGIVTVHRAENTDDPDRLAGILQGLGMLDIPLLFPVHPRTMLRLSSIAMPDNVRKIEPLSYRTMLSLVRRASLVVTDSGGLQKEAIWLGTRCLTLRNETEWIESLKGGWNQLVGADPVLLKAAALELPAGNPPEFGFEDGRFASEHIVEALTR